VTEKRRELVKILNEALAAEYGALWLLPRHMAQVKDEETKRELEGIADDELGHYEKSAEMIHALGARLEEGLPNLQPRSGLREILEAHLQGEREAIALYGRALRLVEDAGMRKQLEQMQSEEEGHQRLLLRALDRLRAGAA